MGKIIDRIYEDGFSDGFNNAKGKVWRNIQRK
jgi:hypothetical protein